MASQQISTGISPQVLGHTGCYLVLAWAAGASGDHLRVPRVLAGLNALSPWLCQRSGE